MDPRIRTGRLTAGRLVWRLQKEKNGVRLIAAERQEMDGVIPEIQPARRAKAEEQQAARVEVQGPKRRTMIRVGSEETQDYVRQKFTFEDFSQEDVNEISFMPSASSEPRGAIHWCDNQCSEQGFIAAMVTEESGEAHTINV